MSSQRLFDSQVLDTGSPLFDSQVSKGCGLKRKNAALDLESDFPETLVEHLPPATMVNIPDDNSFMRQTFSESSQHKALEVKLAASELKVRDLEAQLLVCKKTNDTLRAEVALGHEANSKLQARVQEYGLQLLEVMEEKNALLAEKHARMIRDLGLIHQAEGELPQ
ncbi:hypothetical protein AK812_SmicGene43664 [Symbiodinium microadriaticum]|uniref:Uncharacterized protein n=1 Tax=Symbiodinium microadriaticum TaxID=2951 RepID=A0A1Q9C0G1_SYMMI|nr:hypothetical protein AK812_SmicGene43664 [Symbiodinium microadriaticum]CAE7820433.1 unnamed protein product [Symbiodinium microadriaticum]CAE7938610.1 unnamed protein product [Symbiodinium sp. KB8]